MRAQSSIEFLVFVSIGTIFLISSVVFFGIRAEEVEEMQKISQMKGICRSVSSGISAIYSSGPGTHATMELPGFVAGQNISVWAFGEDRRIIVRDSQGSVACPINVNKMTDGVNSDFEVPKNATLENVEGVVFIG